MFQSTKTFYNYPCTHRAWRDTGHCRFVHGYSRSFKFIFECDERDERGFVMDFGDLDDVKFFLEEWFDHTFLIAQDDPQMDFWEELNDRGLIDLRILPNTSMEGTAAFVFTIVNDLVHKRTDGRVSVASVEVRENDKNSAIYSE